MSNSEEIPQLQMKKIESVQDVIEIATGHSLREFLEKGKGLQQPITFKFPFGLWYRGQSEESWLPHPFVFRSDKNKYYDETSMFYHFKVRSPQYCSTHTTTFDWLCLMQHYELPTRLLDWTESILIALYFAVRNWEDHTNKDARVYILNARLLNYYTSLKQENFPHVSVPDSNEVLIRSLMAKSRTFPEILKDLPTFTDYYSKKKLKKVKALVKSVQKEYSGDSKTKNLEVFLKNHKYYKDYKDVEKIFSRPIAVYPNWSNARTIPQLSTFTLHGGKVYSKDAKQYHQWPIFDPTHLEELNNTLGGDREFLTSVVIEQKAKQGIKKHLNYLGIHEGVLYREIDHQASYIKEIWNSQKNTGQQST